eukprot:TRINITY_DN23688_c0_g1_i1.p1 TRINITY_DN23688_c0_g1~~TRINITY_DN23688_c0_g1_i1.p1  ORF type:complete len:407 (+),score=58.83 TRINITY_DN23688_c0_g1_i1:83-1222(+)
MAVASATSSEASVVASLQGTSVSALLVPNGRKKIPWHLASIVVASAASGAVVWWIVRCLQGRRIAETLAKAELEKQRAKESERRQLELAELFVAVKAISMSVVYIVSNAKSTAFSGPNLAKYLTMKNLPLHDRPGASVEETLAVNGATLLEHLEREGDVMRVGPARLRHAFIKASVNPARLWELFPAMKAAYVQQPLDYGRNSRYGDKWRISCYLVVMESWKPKIQHHEPMLRCMGPIMEESVKAFSHWYCELKGVKSVDAHVMNAFVTRYRPVQDEDQLQRHIDGANVDGSVVLALPTDDPFEGGSLHVWDGKPQRELVYQMDPGDALFLDTRVWHQGMPIIRGTRWALVLFLRLRPCSGDNCVIAEESVSAEASREH